MKETNFHAIKSIYRLAISLPSSTPTIPATAVTTPKMRETLLKIKSKEIRSPREIYLIYNSFSLESSLPVANSCAISRKFGPHQERDPNANDTHVKPRVVRTKLLLEKQEKFEVSQISSNEHFENLFDIEEPIRTFISLTTFNATSFGFFHKYK